MPQVHGVPYYQAMAMPVQYYQAYQAYQVQPTQRGHTQQPQVAQQHEKPQATLKKATPPRLSPLLIPYNTSPQPLRVDPNQQPTRQSLQYQAQYQQQRQQQRQQYQQEQHQWRHQLHQAEQRKPPYQQPHPQYQQQPHPKPPQQPWQQQQQQPTYNHPRPQAPPPPPVHRPPPPPAPQEAPSPPPQQPPPRPPKLPADSPSPILHFFEFQHPCMLPPETITLGTRSPTASSPRHLLPLLPSESSTPQLQRSKPYLQSRRQRMPTRDSVRLSGRTVDELHGIAAPEGDVAFPVMGAGREEWSDVVRDGDETPPATETPLECHARQAAALHDLLGMVLGGGKVEEDVRVQILEEEVELAARGFRKWTAEDYQMEMRDLGFGAFESPV
ncbi:hypothetical protein OQA88_3510 [Cercophora sp. LCS_1]